MAASTGNPLHGKVCVVTGASSGIGKAIAEALAFHGGAVVGFARRFASPTVSRAPQPETILEVALDVTDTAAVDGRFAELDNRDVSVDVVVNCAGGGLFAPFERTEPAVLRALLDTHVVGAFAVTRAALSSMKLRRTGHIINIGSIASQRTFTDCAAYTAAKCAQAGMMRVLTEELRAYGVRCTTIHVGATDTAIWDQRPGFSRDQMLRPTDVAGLVISVLRRPRMSLDEITAVPPGGDL